MPGAPSERPRFSVVGRNSAEPAKGSVTARGRRGVLMTIWNEPRLTVRRANSGVRPEQICPQVHVDLARLGRDEQSLHSWLGNDAGRSSPSDHHRDDRALPVSARTNHTAEVRERPIRVLLAPARRALGRGVSDCSPGRNSEAPRARAGARALHRHAPRRRGGKYEAPRLAQCANASVSAQRLGLLSWTITERVAGHPGETRFHRQSVSAPPSSRPWSGWRRAC